MARRMDPGGDPSPLGATLEEANMTLLDRVAEWPEQWRREGVEEGRQEGVARERELLRRLATLRFGPTVASEVGALLERTQDWDILAAVGELIVRAETGHALTDQVVELVRSAD